MKKNIKYPVDNFLKLYKQIRVGQILPMGEVYEFFISLKGIECFNLLNIRYPFRLNKKNMYSCEFWVKK